MNNKMFWGMTASALALVAIAGGSFVGIKKVQKLQNENNALILENTEQKIENDNLNQKVEELEANKVYFNVSPKNVGYIYTSTVLGQDFDDMTSLNLTYNNETFNSLKSGTDVVKDCVRYVDYSISTNIDLSQYGGVQTFENSLKEKSKQEDTFSVGLKIEYNFVNSSEEPVDFTNFSNGDPVTLTVTNITENDEGDGFIIDAIVVQNCIPDKYVGTYEFLGESDDGMVASDGLVTIEKTSYKRGSKTLQVKSFEDNVVTFYNRSSTLTFIDNANGTISLDGGFGYFINGEFKSCTFTKVATLPDEYQNKYKSEDGDELTFDEKYCVMSNSQYRVVNFANDTATVINGNETIKFKFSTTSENKKIVTNLATNTVYTIVEAVFPSEYIGEYVAEDGSVKARLTNNEYIEISVRDQENVLATLKSYENNTATYYSELFGDIVIYFEVDSNGVVSFSDQDIRYYKYSTDLTIGDQFFGTWSGDSGEELIITINSVTFEDLLCAIISVDDTTLKISYAGSVFTFTLSDSTLTSGDAGITFTKSK